VKIFTEKIEGGIKAPVVTVGVFDGLHRGHQKLLELLKSKAAREGAESLVVTFWPHPRKVLGNADENFRLLTTLEEKKYLLEKWGIDNLLVIPFNREFAAMDSRDFIIDILVNQVGMKHLIVGDDHRFGRNREGGIEILSGLSALYGFSYEMLETFSENQSRISSSLVRDALKAGDLDRANSLLGFPYFLFGNVVEGTQLGRKIGFPTANIACCDGQKLLPREGVYVVKADIENEQFGGMLNIGVRPTVNSTMQKTIEVHIFDLNRDLYGKTLKLSFLHWLRDELKFGSTEELRLQLEKDRVNALHKLSQSAFHGIE